MDPRVKLLFMVLATSLAIFLRDARWMIALTIIVLLASTVLGMDKTFFKKRLLHFIPLMLFLSLTQMLFVKTGTPLIQVNNYILLSSDALERAINLFCRLFIIFSTASIMLSENRQRVITSLSKMRIPYIFSFMLMIALRFLPMFRDSFRNALVSIQLRGVKLKEVPLGKKISLYSSLIFPVLADALLKSQDLAIAMESRGFGAYPKRSYAREVVLKKKDWFIMTVMVVLFVLFLGSYMKGRLI